MAEPDIEPIPTPRAQRLDRFRRRWLPVMVWSACSLLVAGLLINRSWNVRYIGLAQAPEYEISADTAGLVAALAVDLFDDVEAGQMVASLDDSQVAAAVATSDARIRQLRTELEAARARFSDDGLGTAGLDADLRRFQIDEEDRRLEMLSLKVVIESDEIERERLGLELGRMKALYEEGLISQSDYDDRKLLHEQVGKRLENNRLLLVQLEREYRAARQRRREYEKRLPDVEQVEPLLRPLQEAIAVESKRLEEIQVRREALVLRSPIEGRVSRILCRPGQSVVPGEPILVVAEPSVRQIVAYLNEAENLRVSENMTVLVASRHRPGVVAESVIVRVGPTVEMLPERLWRVPQTPDYGRPVVIATSPSMRLLPGEIVDVSFSD